MAPEITIFISCYNERDSVVPTIETVWRALSRLHLSSEILVIDDCSSDGSFDVVAGHPAIPIRLIHHAQNQGLASTIFKAARLGRGKYFWCVAGDNPVPEEEVYDASCRVRRGDIIIPYVVAYAGRSTLRRALSDA